MIVGNTGPNRMLSTQLVPLTEALDERCAHTVLPNFQGDGSGQFPMYRTSWGKITLILFRSRESAQAFVDGKAWRASGRWKNARRRPLLTGFGMQWTGTGPLTLQLIRSSDLNHGCPSHLNCPIPNWAWVGKWVHGFVPRREAHYELVA